MICHKLLRAFSTAGVVTLFAAGAWAADYKEAAHPLCHQDPRDPCVKMTMDFQGKADTTLVVDRIEAKVEDTCKVAMQSGGTKDASTDSLTLPDVKTTTDVVRRAFWFPAGCKVWLHMREPYYLSKDKIVTQTFHLTQDLEFAVGLSGDEAPRQRVR